MSTCGVNTLLQSTHLIADSLVSTKSIKPKNCLLLSTGLLLDSSEFRYEEGTLKIWRLRNNIALAYSGTVDVAERMLICLDKLLRKNENSFLEFEKILKIAAASYTPLPSGQGVDIIGMFIEDQKAIKFVLSLLISLPQKVFPLHFSLFFTYYNCPTHTAESRSLHGFFIYELFKSLMWYLFNMYGIHIFLNMSRENQMVFAKIVNNQLRL